MQLSNEKKAALKIIEQYNNAIKTCLEQNNLSALQETYDLRDELITSFFESFSSALNVSDQVFFEKIKFLDASVSTALSKIRADVSKESSFLKKNREGIRTYNVIGTEK